MQTTLNHNDEDSVSSTTCAAGSLSDVTGRRSNDRSRISNHDSSAKNVEYHNGEDSLLLFFNIMWWCQSDVICSSYDMSKNLNKNSRSTKRMLSFTMMHVGQKNFNENKLQCNSLQ